MSSLSSSSGLSITGGIPTKSQDLAPSIIFIVGFFCLVPLAIFRLASKASRSTTLIRPAVFILVRIATYVVRVIQATGNYSETVFIVEQVFLLAGFPIICEPILSLLEYHITRNHVSPKHALVTQKVMRLLRLALVAALVIGVIAGTQFSSAIGNPDKLAQLRTLRNANGALCIVIVIGVIVVATLAQFHRNLPVTPTILLILMSACLAVAAAYRIANIHITSDPTAVSTKVKFYVLLCLMEWLVTLALFAFNVRTMFAEDLAKAKKEAEKRGEVYRENAQMGTQGSPGQEYKDPYASA